MRVATHRSGIVPVVDLIYDDECPNVHSARELLRAALAQAGFPAQWREWNRASPDTPPALRGFGSPTILVDGTDVSSDSDATTSIRMANRCRLYLHNGRLVGIPALDDIIVAFSRHGRSA